MDVSLSPEGQVGTVVLVRLSRRNLETLLAKLDGAPADSACTIVRLCGDYVVQVTAEENDSHYGDRTPGPMHPATEAIITGAAAGQAAAETWQNPDRSDGGQDD